MSKRQIVLAGGCFWGLEKLYRSFNGIEEVLVGYANGISQEYANYQDVCTGATSFREACSITYEDSIISLNTILDIFFEVIDPTMFNRQGFDFGTQYQTGIYWTDKSDESIIAKRVDNEIPKYLEFYTEVKPLENFFAAEEYHQNYLSKNPNGYCHISVAKINQLKEKYNRES